MISAIGNMVAVLKKEIKCISLYDQNDIDSMYEERELPISGYTISPKEYLLCLYLKKLIFQINTTHIFDQEPNLQD